MGHLGRCDAHVHLLRAGGLEQPHDAQRSRTAHDRVVDERHALARHERPHGRKFHLHALLAHRLRRLDEGTADVTVLDQPHFIGDAAGLRVTDRGRKARIGHADHHVGVGRSLLEKEPARLLAEGVDVATFDVAVGAREIDVLHGAHAVALVHRIVAAADAVAVERDDLARIDVAHELCAHDVQRAGLRADDPAVVEPADRQRTQAVFVAAGVEPVLGHDQEGEPAFEHVERIDDGEDAVLRAVLLLDEVREDLAVGGRVEEAPLVLQVTHQLA